MQERFEMDHDKRGCQAPLERPVLCINNCGFFGSAATMNMCSKCHKDMLLKQEKAKLASESVPSSSSNLAEVVPGAYVESQPKTVKLQILPAQTSDGSSSSSGETAGATMKEGPKRCTMCNKRVGLTGFKCRCGNLFCCSHRYSDKHSCPFDYRTAAQGAIAKANPVVRAEKLDKI